MDWFTCLSHCKVQVNMSNDEARLQFTDGKFNLHCSPCKIKCSYHIEKDEDIDVTTPTGSSLLQPPSISHLVSDLGKLVPFPDLSEPSDTDQSIGGSSSIQGLSSALGHICLGTPDGGQMGTSATTQEEGIDELSDKHAGFFIHRTLSSLNLSLEETEKLKEKYVFAETMSREDALKKVRKKLLLCNIQQRKFPLKMPMKGADVFVYDEELRQVCRLRRPEYCIADQKSKRMGDLLISVKTCSAREHQNASNFFITCPHVLLVRKTLKSL
ncbi:uncharacterized protein LOC120659415 [Panicum virgatum]|uniref:Uncharacterized protein n=1 Tax=Panicum virgatum TaxID=38727 RepID=A0A8T0V620_PANVG|nr:uncharacterized protein LOC120659415 [Panicum virgatum]XP_039793483.1 uncharacterized protein LOC120659415 [Panicum virgatum]XP_039793484.1 uncharacterized protein LOC120659415 [Panicum virgatum]XP_039793485.1 uncharacterized protein LOC120659415 [Panicum virgatum]XP_039793486.1 uncharacterized protein LOC120659415 [Panicum virgatum]XP_039793487.1 uncharacterized protein LOC120659415 [Panicum virgatum]XP_039793489.1 uncharacterized protein LOC120659415 [Panicum virgatum]XP_039793490.1 unc